VRKLHRAGQGHGSPAVWARRRWLLGREAAAVFAVPRLRRERRGITAGLRPQVHREQGRPSRHDRRADGRGPSALSWPYGELEARPRVAVPRSRSCARCARPGLGHHPEPESRSRPSVGRVLRRSPARQGRAHRGASTPGRAGAGTYRAPAGRTSRSLLRATWGSSGPAPAGIRGRSLREGRTGTIVPRTDEQGGAGAHVERRWGIRRGTFPRGGCTPRRIGRACLAELGDRAPRSRRSARPAPHPPPRSWLRRNKIEPLAALSSERRVEVRGVEVRARGDAGPPQGRTTSREAPAPALRSPAPPERRRRGRGASRPRPSMRTGSSSSANPAGWAIGGIPRWRGGRRAPPIRRHIPRRARRGIRHRPRGEGPLLVPRCAGTLGGDGRCSIYHRARRRRVPPGTRAVWGPPTQRARPARGVQARSPARQVHPGRGREPRRGRSSGRAHGALRGDREPDRPRGGPAAGRLPARRWRRDRRGCRRGQDPLARRIPAIERHTPRAPGPPVLRVGGPHEPRRGAPRPRRKRGLPRLGAVRARRHPQSRAALLHHRAQELRPAVRLPPPRGTGPDPRRSSGSSRTIRTSTSTRPQPRRPGRERGADAGGRARELSTSSGSRSRERSATWRAPTASSPAARGTRISGSWDWRRSGSDLPKRARRE
jgi:hypothetical protein